MKNSVFRLTTVIIIVLFSIPLMAQNVTYSEEIEALITKVENNLLFKQNDSLTKGSIEDRMAYYKTPAITVGVVKDFKLHWARAYGWADKEEKRKATTKTLFQAASISKSVNAVGVLHWAEKNNIDIDTDFNNYITWDIKNRKKTKKKPITIANILSHTSGLSGHGFGGYKNGSELPTTMQVLNGDKPANSKRVKSLFEPGLKFKYSGGGTTITQLILSENTGMTYDSYMKENILNPMGMKDSFYTQPPKDTQELATAYWVQGNALDGKYHVYPEMAAAGLWTNPTELSSYIIEMQKSLKGESNLLLSKAMTERMMSPFLENGNTGLGVFFETIDDDVYFTHGGSNEGFRCMYLASKENGRGVIVMINSEKFDIIPEVIRSVLSVYGWAKM